MEYKQEIKNCQNCKKDFIIEPEDFKFYEKIKVPPPTFCPECRLQRRISWRNERVFFKNECFLCKEVLISMYSSSSGLKVGCDNCWWGDGWSAEDYGGFYDFNKNFFVQWRELLLKVPIIQAWRFNNVDSPYINYATEDKNCYLSFSILNCENVFYSYSIDKSQNTLDSLFSNKCIWCYENIDSQVNYNSSFLVNSNNCIDSLFLFDCANCQNCFMSSNLRNKKYFFRNEQYSKENYEKEITKVNFGKFSELQKLTLEFSRLKEQNSIHKFIQTNNAISSSGNNIINSKNCLHSFNTNDSENVKYIVRVNSCKESMDVYGTVEAELVYESSAPSFRGAKVQFSINNQTSFDIKYCYYVHNCKNCFACIGLRNKSYCILNKQYTKEEYEELVPKIIEHMNTMPYIDTKGRIYKYGEFFPFELSPFSYNETIAQEYFPLTKEQALEQGYRWKDRERRNYVIDIKSKDIPDDIKDVNDNIINKVIECEHKGECNEQCTEVFKIIPDEFQFYKRMNLPLPRLCPNCRHYQRLKQRNPLKLWHRKCMKEGCKNEFETSYAPDRPEIVYCERCYQQEIY